MCKAFVKNGFLLLLIATKINRQDIQTHPEQTVPVSSASNNSWGCDVFNVEHHFTRFPSRTFLFFLDCPKPDSPHRLLKCKKARVCFSDLNTAALRLPEVTPALFNYLVLFLLLLLFLKTVNCQQTVQRQCRHFIVTKRVV